MEKNEVEFYQQGWFVILMLIVFTPVGLYLMWKYRSFDKGVRVIVSVVIGLIFVAYISIMGLIWSVVFGTGLLDDGVEADVKTEVVESVKDESVEDNKAVAKTIGNYYSETLEEALLMESVAFAMFKDTVNDSGLTNERKIEVIDETVLPYLDDALVRFNAADVPEGDFGVWHTSMVDGVETLREGVLMSKEGLESDDAEVIQDGYVVANSGDTRFNTFAGSFGDLVAKFTESLK